MILMLIFGGLLAAFSAWTLLQAIPMASHYYANLRSHGIEQPKILSAHVVVIGGWTIGLLIGLGLIAGYFFL